MIDAQEQEDPGQTISKLREWMRERGQLASQRDPNLGTIYFVKCGDLAAVKIGYTKSQCTKARLHTLQTCNPFELSIVLQIDGTEQQEKDLHLKFKKARIRGEWFWMFEDVLQFIEDNQHRSTAL